MTSVRMKSKIKVVWNGSGNIIGFVDYFKDKEEQEEQEVLKLLDPEYEYKLDYNKKDKQIHEIREICVTKIMNDRQKLLLRIPEGAYVEAKFTKKDELYRVHVQEINTMNLSGFQKLSHVIVDPRVSIMDTRECPMLRLIELTGFLDKLYIQGCPKLEFVIIEMGPLSPQFWCDDPTKFEECQLIYFCSHGTLEIIK
jgi:hypothetical protein